jgi:hypothetical protein
MKNKILFSACLILLSCSTTPAPQPKSPKPKYQHVSLFLRKGALTGSFFEQYTLQGDKLFTECGEMQGEKKVVLEDQLVTVTAEKLEDLLPIVNQLSITNAKLEPRGSGTGFFDTGVVQIIITDDEKSREITTSADSVLDQKSGIRGAINDVVEKMRGLSPTLMCGNKSFFGFKKR